MNDWARFEQEIRGQYRYLREVAGETELEGETE